PALKRTVAIKMILSPERGGSLRERFRREIEAVAHLQHPNVVQIHEVGEHRGLPYYCMEFCPRGSLARRLAGAPQPARWSALLLAALARAVEAAHRAGIVHRDLKPANILLADNEVP